MPQPRLLTPALHRALVNMLQGGNYVATACAAVGIHRDTYYEWLRQGQEPGASPELRSFAEDVMQA